MNSVAVPLADRAIPSMPKSRVLRAYAKEAKYEFLRFIRSPAFAVPTLVFPTLFYLLVGFIFGAFRSTAPGAAEYIFAGFATMAAITPGIFGFGIGFAIEREQGVFTLKRALPMPPAASLLGKMAMAMFATCLALPMLMVAAVTLGGVTTSLQQLPILTAVLALGSLPFCAIGLLVGSMTSSRGAPAVANVIYIALVYMSGLFLPLPKAIGTVVMVSPAFYLHQLALTSIGAKSHLIGGIATHALVLLAFALLFVGLALRRFSRAS